MEQINILREAEQIEEQLRLLKVKLDELLKQMDTETFIRFGNKTGYLDDDQVKMLTDKIDEQKNKIR